MAAKGCVNWGWAPVRLEIYGRNAYLGQVRRPESQNQGVNAKLGAQCYERRIPPVDWSKVHFGESVRRNKLHQPRALDL
jgi:hypothetical protein